MASRVKGIVVEIGGDTTGLDKALKDTNKQINTTQSSLKDVERLLKLDPKNTTLLAQKQRLLADVVSETQRKLDALNNANVQASASVKNYDAWKVAYNPIKEQIDTVSDKLNDLKKQQTEIADRGEINSETYIQLSERIQMASTELAGLKKQAKEVNEYFGDPISPEQYDALQREILETELQLSKLKDSANQAKTSVKATSKEIKDYQTELNKVNKLLDSDANNFVLLTQKQEILEDAINQTEYALREMEDEYNRMLSEADNGVVKNQKEFRELGRQIEESKISLRTMKSEAEKTDKAIDGIDEKPIDAVADAADKAEDALEDAGKQASSFGEHLKAELSADGLEAIADTLKDVAEESKEHRKVMASLEVSSEDAGYSAEQTAEAYKKLYGILGDDQAAATTTANFQALHLSQDNLKSMIDGVVGAWSKYGDSIPIDGLSEAINETIKTGQVTGNLADVLNWGSKEGETFGVRMREASEANQEWNASVEAAETAEDYFNLALEECATETERVNLVMQMLADQGLTSAGKAWQQNNQSMIESNEAQADLQEQLAELGEMVEPIFTKITNAVAGALKWFNSLDSGTQTFILTIVGLIAVVAALTPIVSGVISVFQGLSSVISFLAANPIVLIIAAVVALIAIFVTLWNKCEGFRNSWINLWEGIKSTAVSVWNFLNEKVFRPIGNAFTDLWNGIKCVLNGMFRGIESFLNGIIGGVNFLIRAINKISFDVPDWVPGIGGKKLGFNLAEVGTVSLPQLAKGGTVLRGSAIVGEAGPELLTVQPGRTMVQPLNSTTTNHNSTNLGNVSIVVYGAPGQDEDQLAERVLEKFQTAYASKEVSLV